MTTTAPRPDGSDHLARARAPWWPVAGLLLLCVVPVAAGTARLVRLARGAVVTPDNERFFHSPAPVVVHVVGVTLFCVLGALQFVPALRRGRPGWHRASGRVVVPAGLAAAASGIWMTLFYDLPAKDTLVLNGVRLLVGAGMLVALVLAVAAIRRRDVLTHRAWMARAYALGMGAGTQVATVPLGLLLTGSDHPVQHTVTMTLAWVLNLAVVEVALRRTRPVTRPRATAVPTVIT